MKKKYQLIRAEPGTGKALVLRTGMSKKKAWGLYYSLVYMKYAFYQFLTIQKQC